MSRRDFLKLMGAAGTVLTFAPFVDWGKFLPNPRPETASKTKVQLPSGPANVNSFPINSSAVVIYPLTNDPVLNNEAFRTWQLIRLPAEMGGAKTDATAFRLYSSVCLHLWCLWKYYPREKDPSNPGKMRNGNGQCPCHGSMYDPLNGKAYQGPASIQAPPSNALPQLDLEVDGNGDLWILPPVWSLDRNGIIGYGRYLQS